GGGEVEAEAGVIERIVGPARLVEIDRERQRGRHPARVVEEDERDRVRLVRPLGERHVHEREPGGIAEPAAIQEARGADRAALGAEPALTRQRGRELADDRPLERGGDPRGIPAARSGTWPCARAQRARRRRRGAPGGTSRSREDPGSGSKARCGSWGTPWRPASRSACCRRTL